MVSETDGAPGLDQRGTSTARPCRRNLQRRRRRNARVFEGHRVQPRPPGLEPQLSDFYHPSGGQRDRDPVDGRNRPGGLQTRVRRVLI